MQGDDVTACPAGRHRRCGLGVGVGALGTLGPEVGVPKQGRGGHLVLSTLA